MKNIYNYTFQLVCVYILALSCFSISNFDIEVKHYISSTHNVNENKMVDSNLLAKTDENTKDILEDEKESIKDEVNQENDTSKEIQKLDKNTESNEQKEEQVKNNKPIVEETVNIIDTSSYAVLSQEIINLSHYGHDCYGCTSGYTASGYYVGDGKIYYQDPTFGSVRVIAADNKYPLGTIVRIGYHSGNITAIVLDRGGGIGDGKNFQVDLLTSSNSEAYKLGIVNNTSLEVLRLGY